MGRRHEIRPYKVFDAVDISTNQTQGTPYTTIDGLDRVDLELDWSGSAPVGTLFVDVCSYYEKSGAFSTWVPLDFGTSISISGNSGQHIIQINNPPFTRMRLRYVATSGTGNMTATLSGTVRGA